MHLIVDLRYVFPPLINLMLLLFLTSENGSIFVLVNTASKFDQYPFLNMALLVIAVFLFVVFLLTSIKLPLTAHPITVRAGHFSGPLTFSLFASIFFPPPLFYIAYLIVIITSPWHGMLWNLQKCIFKWFYQNLQSIPTLVVSCAQQQDDPEAVAPPQLEVEVVYVEGNPMQI
ncbi:hypothetical protein ACOSQ3_025853 [Xanthoceras sorbifolium]